MTRNQLSAVSSFSQFKFALAIRLSVVTINSRSQIRFFLSVLHYATAHILHILLIFYASHFIIVA